MVSSEQTINKVTTITEVKKVRVDFVVHPVTMEKIDYNQAVAEGMCDKIFYVRLFFPKESKRNESRMSNSAT